MALGCVALIAAATYAAPPSPFLINDTPSVPLGLWVRSGAALKRGTVIAFHPPPAAAAFVRERLPRYITEPILKPIAAVPGDRVCAAGDGFEINGRPIARALAVDHTGRPVAPWTGCRQLQEGEWVVISTRIPNSYDSRYYGPVGTGQIVGTYRPLWTW